MEITIIGWYGTETIGDRAILAGIVNVISEVFTSFGIRLGSLYPFFSERTVLEDSAFLKSISSNTLNKISVFDTRSPSQLKDNIIQSDLLMVGGGPLMDLNEMNMLEYAFVLGRRYNKKSILFGCGWGPLNNSQMISKAIHLIDLSDIIVFRDSISKQQFLINSKNCKSKVVSSIDPAFFAGEFFLSTIREHRTESYIAINFRDVQIDGHYSTRMISEDELCGLVEQIINQIDLPVFLIPMHYFDIGGDDRRILTRIEHRINSPKVKTIHKPFSLFDTMECFYHARFCVGMRFHSIVLQTILNGNNYILDYTDPVSGKISGMMKQLELSQFYINRRYSPYENNGGLQMDITNRNRFEISKSILREYKNIYLDALKALC